jgi:hypothetical protein
MPKERVYKLYELRKIDKVLEYLQNPLVRSFISAKYGEQGYKVLMSILGYK